MNENTNEDVEFEIEEEYGTCNITKVDNGFITSLGSGPDKIFVAERDYDLDDKEGFQGAMIKMFYDIAEYFGLGNNIIKKSGEKTLVIDLKEL